MINLYTDYKIDFSVLVFTFPPSSLYQISFISVFKEIRSRTHSIDIDRTGSTNFKNLGD